MNTRRFDKIKPYLMLLPAFIGIGTILTAFFMGPLIDFFNRKLAQPMLCAGEKK